MIKDDVKAKEIEQKVIDVVAESLKIDRATITLESRFGDDLRADSLDQVELMMAFEEEFGCEIPDSEAGKLASVANVVEYIINNILKASNA